MKRFFCFRNLFLFLSLAIWTPSMVQGQMRVQSKQSIGQNRLNDNPLLSDYDVKFYGLDVEVNNRSARINGSVNIVLEVTGNQLSTLVFELNNILNVEKVIVEGNELPFSHQDHEVIIPLASPVMQGKLLSIDIFYGGSTGGGMVSQLDDNWDVPVTFTLSEPFFAKDWFPCKEDLEDKADSVNVFITTDYGLMGVSQGIHTGTTYFPNGKVRYEWKSKYPIAFYLISIAVADYREYNIETQPPGFTRPILIQNFVYDVPGCLEAYQEEIDVTIPIMNLFCDLFGPYPFSDEKYGHYMWPWGGGMEHQTMTGMGSFDFFLVAHELGHSWFGDHVTCASWQDIWINEGFAMYAEYLATESMFPEYADNERSYYFSVALQEPERSVYIPAAEANSDSRIFSWSLSYCKGMALVHMIRYELDNDAIFFEVLRNFLQQYGNTVAFGLDFKEVLEETSGMDFTDFFDQWYFGGGYPIYNVSHEQQGDTLILNSIQTTSSPSTPLFKMPLEIMIHHEKGDSLVRVYQDENQETFKFFFSHHVDDIQVDPGDHVLNKLATGKVLKKKTTDQFSIFPNPGNGVFKFVFPGERKDDVVVEIYSLTGRLEYSRIYKGCIPQMSYVVQRSGLDRGIHIVRFGSSQHDEVIKLFVE